ncbi:lytic transglycosylase domain-containing protein [Octadecabacter sp.]|nr:lytic transglycosylase domain-containing protein [Octadecabacter sp.]
MSAPQVQVHSQNYNDSAAQYGIKRSAGIAQSLNKWASSKFQEIANTQHEASILDGQMAFQQGKTMDEVEMEGDKWSLSGYRVMHAQTLSQTMLAAQREMIRQSQYEQDPDEFRAQYVRRLEAQIEGLDPQTARMVQEQMTEQMPTLVAEHTTANLGYQEREAYKSLVTSVDALSQDASAFDALLVNAAGGPGSPSAGLSSDRRMNAIVDGVGAAFENMNPMAYQQLKQSGLLESMSTAQKQSMRAAQQAYESRVRTTYDEEHTEALSNWQRRLDAGDLEPAEAAEELASIWGRRQVTMSAAEGGAAYSGAVSAQDHGDRARVANIATATVRGDWDSVARQTQDIVMHFESGGDLNAVGPLIEGGANRGDRAQGAMQVMPLTMADPGFGIRPSNGTQADTLRVGRDYWAMNVARYNGNIEAAAIGYNAGPGNADKWIAAGGGEAGYAALEAAGVRVSETRPYAEGIAAAAGGEALHYTSSERLSMAQAELRSATTIRNEIMADAENARVVESTILHNDRMVELDTQLNNGTIAPSVYRTQASESLASLGLTQTVAQGNRINTQITAAAEAATTAATAESLAAVKLQQVAAHDVLTRTLETPGITVEQAQAATKAFTEQVAGLYNAAGFTLADTDMNQVVNGALAQQRQAEAAIAEFRADGQVIARALSTGTVDQLPAKLRDRAEREATARVEKTIAEGVANGSIADEQVLGLVNSAMEANAVQSGTVTQDVQAISTLSMRNMIGPDGRPTEAAIQTVLKYGRLYDESTEAANSMFTTPESINTMAAVFQAASGNLTSPQLVGDAIMAAHGERETTLGITSVRTPANQDYIASEVTSGVDAWLRGEDIGVLQGIGRGDTDISSAWQQTNVEQDIAGSNETRDYLEGAVTVQANRLLREDPALSANIAVQRATSLVLDRTTIIGGTPHVMDPGFEINTQMFGELASTYDKPGVEGEAITGYLANLIETGELSEEFGAVSAWEATPGAGIALGIGNAIAGVFGGEVGQRVMKPMDAIAVANRGVRPYIFETDSQGGVAGVRFLTPAGDYTPRLDIDLSAAGALYIQQRNQELSE